MEKHQYKLIEGIFSTAEAKTVLMSVITSKINYHNLNAFSEFVRNNKAVENTKNRVLELTTTREDIIKLIEDAEKMGMKLNIKSDITIELI
ncbi:hypothetical protein [Flavobacterium paronense]|uniref:Uncharacterized protein n=2 Tax=Flavobacterium paronense TaxID=1392775 RepID=A0ABV5GA85_9FLAO